MTARISTQKKILNAAETLFSRDGFEQTSLRQITQEAGVNLASVNYHFGSKKALIQAVMARYLVVFMPVLEEQLQLAEQQSELKTEELFKRFKIPLAKLTEVNKHGPDIFLRLLGFAYSEIQGHLRKYTQQEFGGVLQHLLALLKRANPHLSEQQMFWRLHFILGAAVFAQVSGQALIEIAQAEFNQKVNAQDVIDHLIPFVSGGLEEA
ncbi:TetR family transcriptional regulator [Idiomarina ramblicola]|uniref:TetR family transcriptional regulator n=2 Tax=Idiomarina ramblicola TaxID=263724 RepID=A0A432YZ26_9GAMM|nr:TetR family transcriptional regulator [Idiomarina ramblicola]